MPEVKQSIYLMGTRIDLQIEHSHPQKIMTEVICRLKIYENRFSANNLDSELMQINQNSGIKPVVVHPELYYLIKVGKLHSCVEKSNLNIAIGPLVQIWRIGFADAQVPTSKEIKSLLLLTNPTKILLNDDHQSVFLLEKGMSLDLGSLAKGYIADLLLDYLKAEKVDSALINLGGNLVTWGFLPNLTKKIWRIGIQDPFGSREQYLKILKISNQSVVTSGIYERKLAKDHQVYHHIFNPQTGYPTKTDVFSLTIVSDKSLDGEIWTTRLFGLNSQEMIVELNKNPLIEGLVVSEKGIFYSQGLANYLVEDSW